MINSEIKQNLKLVAVSTLILLIGIALSSCAQLNSLAIDETDNAMACVRGSTNAVTGVFGGSVSGITVELPAQTDTTSYTADDWRILAEICDQ